MRDALTALLTVVLLVTAAGCAQNGASAGDDDGRIETASAEQPTVDVQSDIRQMMSDADSASNVYALYAERDFRPAWVEGDGGTQTIAAALELMCESASHGLNPADYVSRDLAAKVEAAYGSASETNRSSALAELDVAVSERLMELADDLITGRVNPKEFGGMWKTPVHSIDPVDIVATAAGKSDPASIAQEVANNHEQYTLLLDALEKYRSIQQDGGLPRVESGPLLSEGDSSLRVVQVRRRLIASGDLDPGATPDTSRRYTEAIASGVRAFQERHGLKIDGIVGENVLASMNMPVDERIRKIELNLERWRWIPRHLGGRYLYVNIPAFQLRAFDNGEEVLQSNVVVGKQYDARATPVFSDTMEYVVFNPYWNIPRSIASEEILPQARQNPSYLAANDYEIVTGWGQGADVVPATARNMNLVESGDYRLRQEPGPQNALGRIKFMFPNQFDIYLHDTPADHLFERRDRAYSHGCIRVEKEVELAEYAFADWGGERIRQEIESREYKTKDLENPVPVYILYWTTFVDDEGRVHFREDIYGHDEALRSALAQQAPSSDPTTCSSLTSALGSDQS